MKFNIKPSIIIFVLGFGGLVFTLVDDYGEIGSKIPIAIFFIVIMSIGIIVEMKSKDKSNEIFGEIESPRKFG